MGIGFGEVGHCVVTQGNHLDFDIIMRSHGVMLTPDVAEMFRVLTK
jgi:hypothetical protein